MAAEQKELHTRLTLSCEIMFINFFFLYFSLFFSLYLFQKALHTRLTLSCEIILIMSSQRIYWPVWHWHWGWKSKPQVCNFHPIKLKTHFPFFFKQNVRFAIIVQFHWSRTFRGMRSLKDKDNQIFFENQNLIECVPSVGCRSLKDKDKRTKFCLRIKILLNAYLPWDVEVSKPWIFPLVVVTTRSELISAAAWSDYLDDQSEIINLRIISVIAITWSGSNISVAASRLERHLWNLRKSTIWTMWKPGPGKGPW